MTRRELLAGLPALSFAPRLLAADATIAVRSFNHATLTVTDPKRSIEFYQSIFGMPIQARQGQTTVLRIGDGPQFIALSGGADAKPGINHFCMATERFDLDRTLKILAAHGITKADSGGGLAGGPMKFRVRMRGPDQGGAKDGTPELYIGDPDGLVVQLQDASYCGGSGALGENCGSHGASLPKKIALVDFSHFTLFVSDAQRSMAFYQGLFGLAIQAHQGPSTPLLAVGGSKQFLTIAGMGAGRNGAPPPPPAINHLSFTMENFDPERVMKTLAESGLKPRENGRGPAGPLTYYVSMRMENRGGAKDGTPELYFTDPDGNLLQIQDVTYCGGAGKLGEVCS